MSDLREIKNRIYDEELIKEILENLECDYINEEQNGNLITAQLPSNFQSKNKRAIQVKNNESLTSYIRNKGIAGDIFSVIGFILFDCKEFEDVKENLFEIKAWLCNLFDWQEYMDEIIGIVEKPKNIDYNSWLRPFQSKRKAKEKQKAQMTRRNKPLDKYILTRFIIQPHIEFIKSGINCKTQKVFEIGYCKETERVIYPIYDNLGSEIVGIKGRYVGNNKTVADTKKISLSLSL